MHIFSPEKKMVERNKYGADIFIDSYWLRFNGLHFIFKVQGSVSRAIHFASWTWTKLLACQLSSPLHRRDWQKEESPKSSSLKILHEQAVHWFPVPLGQILELPAKTCTEFSNECRWTGGERLYSIRSAVNTLAYRKYLYVNLQWLSLIYLNTVKSFPIFMLL